VQLEQVLYTKHATFLRKVNVTPRHTIVVPIIAMPAER